MDTSTLGRALVGTGIVLVLVGLAVLLGGRIPGLGRLPGDVVVRRGNFTFYFPLVTSLLVSLFLTLVLYLVRRR